MPLAMTKVQFSRADFMSRTRHRIGFGRAPQRSHESMVNWESNRRREAVDVVADVSRRKLFCPAVLKRP